VPHVTRYVHYPRNSLYYVHVIDLVHELSYVAAGYLSDRPDIPLYLPTRVLRTTQLQLYRNLRTSSSLEGYHQHLNGAFASCGKRCGLRYFEAATNAFDWRWTVRALVKAGVLPSYDRPALQPAAVRVALTVAPTAAPTAAPMAAPAAAPAARGGTCGGTSPAMAASPGRLRTAAAALGLDRWL
jgi:hypothetical protein